MEDLKVYIITGISGSGKATVAQAFDNMPMELVPRVLELSHGDTPKAKGAAFVMDMRPKTFIGLGHNIGHSVGWVERSETQQRIGVGFRSSTQPTRNSDGLKYDQGPFINTFDSGIKEQ